MTREFTVDRSTLLTGAALRAFQSAGYDPCLYDPMTGLSCILGQYLQSVGLPSVKMAGKYDVTHLDCGVPPEANWLLASPKAQSSVAYALNETNDNWKLHQIRREAKLTKLFASQNITVRFSGKYADATRRAKIACKVA